MVSVPFDTLKAFKDLQEAGFDQAQAEAVIATVGNAIVGNLATKDYLREMATKDDIREMATKEEVASVRREMATKADLHALEIRMMVRLGGMMIAVAGVTIATVRLLS